MRGLVEHRNTAKDNGTSKKNPRQSKEEESRNFVSKIFAKELGGLKKSENEDKIRIRN